MVFQCCVRGCKTVAKNGLHSFPSNKSLAEKWIYAIRSDHLIELLNEKKLARSYHKVCKKHFRDIDFAQNLKGKSELIPNSVPSLFLPDEAIQYTNVEPQKSSKSKQPAKRLPDGGGENLQISANAGSSMPSGPKQPTKQPQRHNLISDSISLSNAKVDKEECDDQWVDVDSVNDLGVSSTNELWQEYGERTYQHWKTTERKLLRQNRDLKKKLSSVQLKLKENKVDDKKVIEYLSTGLNEMQLEFIKMQITNRGRPKHGRRYTSKQKSMCLAMYKQGPKLYRFLETGFVLPTKKTLGRHSANVLFTAGVDFKVLKAVKNAVSDWPEEHKYCTILWDEVSLKEHLDYCSAQDIIEGFVQMSSSQIPKFATHALTFMVRGIKISFKQSIGFFYTNGLFAFELVELIKIMIGATITLGLNPLLSVCDQVYTNASAVNSLVNPNSPANNDGRLLVYTVHGRRIIHCYDPSHLIKTVRNNLQTKDLVHYMIKPWCKDGTNFVGSKQLASWDHIFDLYRKDSQSTKRLLPKLTDEHLAPVKLKMKVSLATQIFSNTCGSVMLKCIEEKEVPRHFTGTAHFLLFMNDVFDSMNGSVKQIGDTLKGAVKANSIHFSFWDYALSVLPEMYFIDKADGKMNNRSSVLKKLESAVRGYVEFSKTCLKLDLFEVSIRDTSQDGLENFFGCVKSCNQANKPTPREYRTSYATMVINNITGTNSLHSNCEQDQSVSVLDNIHDFVLGCNKDPSTVTCNTDSIIAFDPIDQYPSDQEQTLISDIDELVVFEPLVNDTIVVESKAVSHMVKADDLVVFDPEVGNETNNYFETGALSRVAGSIYRKLMKSTQCKDCKLALDIMETIFVENCTKIFRRLNKAIPHICFETSLKKKLLTNIESIATDTIGCPDHGLEMTLKLKELCTYEAITYFCYDINRYLSGKINILPINHNHIQEQAIIHKRKTKRIEKYSDIFSS